jgi:acetoin utilization deacetylase AcuC-like enzyme
MKTLYYEHDDFLHHLTGIGHPESPERVKRISAALANPDFDKLIRISPPLGTEALVRLIHSQKLIDTIRANLPKEGSRHLDNDTVLSPLSLQAALRAVGASCDAVDQIMAGKADNAFCAVRPPGHHAEPEHAMGFCLFNNVAVAAEYARQHYQLKRIAIVDFDVHHGNGTQEAFKNQAQVLYASSHEIPHYPGTGYPNETGVGNIINVPLSAGETGESVRKKYSDIILPALDKFKPEFLFISAGFDAHAKDPLADIQLVEEDYGWLTTELMKVAAKHCQNRLVSILEGGYHLKALADSVGVHVRSLMGEG